MLFFFNVDIEIAQFIVIQYFKYEYSGQVAYFGFRLSIESSNYRGNALSFLIFLVVLPGGVTWWAGWYLISPDQAPFQFPLAPVTGGKALRAHHRHKSQRLAVLRATADAA